MFVLISLLTFVAGALAGFYVGHRRGVARGIADAALILTIFRIGKEKMEKQNVN